MSKEAEIVPQWCSCTSNIFRSHHPFGRPTPKPAVGAKKSCNRRQFKILFTSEAPENFTYRKAIPPLETAYNKFIRNFFTSRDEFMAVDRIRAEEYPHLNAARSVSMDYSGFGLFSCRRTKTAGLYSVPVPGDLFMHAMYGPSEQSLESWMKRRIIRFLKLDELDYGMVFTTTRELAFKLLSASYPYQRLLTVYDYESEAVQAMHVRAASKGAKSFSARFVALTMGMCARHLRKVLAAGRKSEHGLFVLPLQSCVTGTCYSYNWITRAKSHGWRVLLDASGLGAKDFGTMAMSILLPDFILCSFYKVYGQDPTCFGCLLVKNSTIGDLKRCNSRGLDPHANGCLHVIAPPGVSRLLPRDQSLSPMSPLSYGYGATKKNDDDKFDESKESSSKISCNGLDHAQTFGFTKICNMLTCLVNWLVIAIGPKVRFVREASLAFNIYDCKGDVVDPILVQSLGDRSNISLRCYFLQNPCSPFGEDNTMKVIDGTVKVVSASLCFLSNFEDLYRLWAFVARFLDADFVEKENWRYLALNQETIQV